MRAESAHTQLVSSTPRYQEIDFLVRRRSHFLGAIFCKKDNFGPKIVVDDAKDLFMNEFMKSPCQLINLFK